MAACLFRFISRASVSVIADRDEAGLAHAASVAESLAPFAQRVRTVQSAVKSKGADAHDHFAAGYGPADFIEYVPGALDVEVFGDEFEAVSVKFLWEPYLPLGKCVLLDADGGTGKSSLGLAIAAGLSNGVLPVSGAPCEPCKTFYLHRGEDDSRELETVYRGSGGKPGSITFYGRQDLCFDPAGVTRVSATIRALGVKLIVVDALMYFLHGVLKDTNVMLEVLPVMERLNRLAADLGVCVLNIRHTTKGRVGKDASELGLGSVAFRNSHRGQLVMRYHPNERGLIVVTDEKGSILVERGESFAFRRVGTRVEYVHDFEDPWHVKRASRGPKAESLQTAIDVLCELLNARNEVPWKEALDHVMCTAQCGRTTAYRAKERVGVVDRNGMWYLDPLASDTAEASWAR